MAPEHKDHVRKPEQGPYSSDSASRCTLEKRPVTRKMKGLICCLLRYMSTDECGDP